jgi:hypothetical protein
MTDITDAHEVVVTQEDREAALPLPNYLRALASDCEWTDGWEAAAPDLLAAAVEIERSRSAIAELVSALEEARKAIASLDEEEFGLMHDGHGGFLGFVRDQLLYRIDGALTRAQVSK